MSKKKLEDYSREELRQKLLTAKTPRDKFNYAVALIDRCMGIITYLQTSEIELEIEIIDKKLKSNSLPPEERKRLEGKKRRYLAMLDANPIPQKIAETKKAKRGDI